MKIDHDDLVAKFAQSAGIEKASDVVDAAVVSLGWESKSAYTSSEVRDICDAIRDAESGYLRLVASEIQIHVQAQERFGALLENVPDPAVVVSFDGVDPVVDHANTAFAETFGYDGPAASGRTLDDLIVPADAASAADVWAVSGDPPRREIRRQTADGEVRTFLFRPVVVTREMGEVEGYGIYTDITERERRERKLERKNDQLERFVSVVSHDLRNPLNVASGQTELAMDLAEDEAVLDRLETVAAAHERMETLIQDLLTLARHGETVGDTSPVDLEAVSRDAWAGVETGDGTLEVGSLPTIVADPSRTRELLSNLFRNAVEHGSASPPGDEDGDAETADSSGSGVTVRVRKLDGADGSGFVVEDDGPGIPSAEREDMFEHGYSTAETGTGFGLSIIRAIVEAHGWEIDLAESEGGGARFEISSVARYDS